MSKSTLVRLGIVTSLFLLPTTNAWANTVDSPSAPSQDGQRIFNSSQVDEYQVDVVPGSAPISFSWYQPSRLRDYWGPSYATSTEYLLFVHAGKAKAAGNIFNGLRIVQVCIWYTRGVDIISDVVCSNASSDTGVWLAGPVATTTALDTASSTDPKTIFHIKTTRIDPSIF
jgi:hypothetical protein